MESPALSMRVNECAAAAPPTGRLGIIHRAAVLMLRDGEDAAQGWEGEYKPAFDRKKMWHSLCGAME